MNTNARPDLPHSATLSMETAKIEWAELQRFFAAGNVYHLSSGQDLPLLAEKFKSDDAKHIEQLLDTGNLKLVSDTQARTWLDQKSSVWAVVVAPYVLVQNLET